MDIIDISFKKLTPIINSEGDLASVFIMGKQLWVLGSIDQNKASILFKVEYRDLFNYYKSDINFSGLFYNSDCDHFFEIDSSKECKCISKLVFNINRLPNPKKFISQYSKDMTHDYKKWILNYSNQLKN